MKYLLSTGRSTTKIEKYILDLIRLHMSIQPGDIPFSDAGFNFILTDVKKDQAAREIESRITSLIERIGSRFKGISINLTNLAIVDETRAEVTISIDDYSDTYSINLYD